MAREEEGDATFNVGRGGLQRGLLRGCVKRTGLRVEHYKLSNG